MDPLVIMGIHLALVGIAGVGVVTFVKATSKLLRIIALIIAIVAALCTLGTRTIIADPDFVSTISATMEVGLFLV